MLRSSYDIVLIAAAMVAMSLLIVEARIWREGGRSVAGGPLRAARGCVRGGGGCFGGRHKHIVKTRLHYFLTPCVRVVCGAEGRRFGGRFTIAVVRAFWDGPAGWTPQQQQQTAKSEPWPPPPPPPAATLDEDSLHIPIQTNHIHLLLLSIHSLSSELESPLDVNTNIHGKCPLPTTTTKRPEWMESGCGDHGLGISTPKSWPCLI